MENGKVTVSTPGKLVLRAAIVEINGSQVLVNAGMVQCSGVLKADTVDREFRCRRELYAGRGKCVVTGTGEAGNVDW